MSEDKRQKARHKVTSLIHVRVCDRMSSRLLGKLANIHDEGFMIISTEGEVEHDHIYQLVFEDEELKPMFKLGAECLWTTNAAGEQLWAGFQIIDIADDEMAKMGELIDRMQGSETHSPGE